jgi:hypothetical protein
MSRRLGLYFAGANAQLTKWISCCNNHVGGFTILTMTLGADVLATNELPAGTSSQQHNITERMNHKMSTRNKSP